MRRMIEELYFGNLNPNEKQFDRNSEYAETMKTISENEEKLTLLLYGREKQLFLNFVNAQSGLNTITALENFIAGFRLGARIGIEVMDGEDGMLRDIV